MNLDCDEEARQILQASLTDPPIRHAVLSLRALRNNLETSADIPAGLVQHTPSYSYGLQQYNMALGGLASNLSCQRSNRLKSALLCCQIFISIEQVQKNYAAVAQHFIRGLQIMHEYRARPGFVAVNKLVPANNDELPFLDIFVIKLFAAPCKFAEPLPSADSNGTTSSEHLASCQNHIESRDLRKIAPDMRTQLTRIAASVHAFLEKVSRVESLEIALQLLSEKEALLNTLELWLIDLERARSESNSLGPEPITMSFLRFFHLMLKIILLVALDSSPDLYSKLRPENDRLQGLADVVAERVKDYRMYSGTSINHGKRFTARCPLW